MILPLVKIVLCRVKATLTVCSYCQGFGEVAQALVLEARVNAVAGHSMKL